MKKREPEAGSIFLESSRNPQPLVNSLKNKKHQSMTWAVPDTKTQVRALPEKFTAGVDGYPRGVSPGRNAGCGLKHSFVRRPQARFCITRQKCRVWIETSAQVGKSSMIESITRQKCRVWIETCYGRLRHACFVRITRQKCRVWIETLRIRKIFSLSFGITRQKCRVWIETIMPACVLVT